jgi:hypothetical protein
LLPQYRHKRVRSEIVFVTLLVILASLFIVKLKFYDNLSFTTRQA